MSIPAFTLAELLEWHDETANQWKSFFKANPTLLDTECDVFDAGTVLGLVRHIFAVEIRYAQRLSGAEMTPYKEVVAGPIDALYSLHAESVAIFKKILADEKYDWNLQHEFKTLSAGVLKASQRKIFIHSHTHALRHWAQLSTLARLAGFKPDFAGDILMSSALI